MISSNSFKEYLEEAKKKKVVKKKKSTTTSSNKPTSNKPTIKKEKIVIPDLPVASRPSSTSSSTPTLAAVEVAPPKVEGTYEELTRKATEKWREIVRLRREMGILMDKENPTATQKERLRELNKIESDLTKEYKDISAELKRR